MGVRGRFREGGSLHRTGGVDGARGVAIRQFPLERGLGFADYLLYIDGKAAGVIEAKRRGMTLIEVEVERRLSIVERLGREVAAGLARAARLRQAVLARAFAGAAASASAYAPAEAAA